MFSNEVFEQARNGAALVLRDSCIETDSERVGGKPVLKGTRFTVSQMLAELSEGIGPSDLGSEFNLDPEQIVNALRYLAYRCQKPEFLFVEER